MGVLYNSRIVTDGLVLCLDAGDKMSYPGAGTTWYDLTANKNNMTLYNGPTFTTENGGAIVFDGTDDYAKNINNDFTQVTNFTIEICIKLNQNLNSGSNFRGIFSTVNGTDGYQLFWRPGSGYDYFYFYRGGTALHTATGSSFSSGDILNLVVVWDSSNINNSFIYINNEDKTDTRGSTSTSNSTDYLTLGGPRADLNSGYYLNQDIYFCKMYNRVLSRDEITQNYKATKGRFGL